MSSVAVVALLGACDSSTESTAGDTTTPPAGQAASAPVPAPSDTAPTLDEATRKACTEMFASIDENAKLAAAADKIGPPAGHIAVGAQYIAGSADLYAKSINATDPTVLEAAGKVAEEMKALDEAYQETPSKKPSKAKLNKSVTALKTACGES